MDKTSQHQHGGANNLVANIYYRKYIVVWVYLNAILFILVIENFSVQGVEESVVHVAQAIRAVVILHNIH